MLGKTLHICLFQTYLCAVYKSLINILRQTKISLCPRIPLAFYFVQCLSTDIFDCFKLALLQNPDVLWEIDNPHSSQDGTLQDVVDGEFYKNHPIFSVHEDALVLLGYYDDLEIANPLGSKSKIHKIGR